MWLQLNFIFEINFALFNRWNFNWKLIFCAFLYSRGWLWLKIQNFRSYLSSTFAHWRKSRITLLLGTFWSYKCFQFCKGLLVPFLSWWYFGSFTSNWIVFHDAKDILAIWRRMTVVRVRIVFSSPPNCNQIRRVRFTFFHVEFLFTIFKGTQFLVRWAILLL